MWIMGKCSMDAFLVLKSFQHSSQIICRCVPREPAQKHAYDWKFKTVIKNYKEIGTEITTGNNNNNKRTVGQKFVLFRIQHWKKSIESEMLILAEKTAILMLLLSTENPILTSIHVVVHICFHKFYQLEIL